MGYSDKILNIIIEITLKCVDVLKSIISHPNTPAYIQSVLIVVGFVIGAKYLKKRALEKKFELVVRANKYCLLVADFLMGIKQPNFIVKDLDTVEKLEKVYQKKFTQCISILAQQLIDELNKNKEIFNNLYNCYIEMTLFFEQEEKIIQPIKDLIYIKKRIYNLLETLSYFQNERLLNYNEEKGRKIFRNAMVQIWETIELTDWQEREQEDLIGKGHAPFYYLDNMIKKAIIDTQREFPKLIKSMSSSL
jgi:hypothetical protein